VVGVRYVYGARVNTQGKDHGMNQVERAVVFVVRWDGDLGAESIQVFSTAKKAREFLAELLQVHAKQMRDMILGSSTYSIEEFPIIGEDEEGPSEAAWDEGMR